MVNSLDIEKRAQLKRFGFSARAVSGTGMMLEGFDSHEATLYLHRTDTKQFLTIKMHIGNPKQIDNAESDYLVNKMQKGYFLWPKEECLSHNFHLSWWADAGINGRKQINGPDMQGCEWCREDSTKGSEAAVTEATPEQAQEAVLSEPSASHTSVTPPKVMCDTCGFEVSTIYRRTKKAISLRAQQRALTLHQRKHSARIGVPA